LTVTVVITVYWQDAVLGFFLPLTSHATYANVSPSFVCKISSLDNLYYSVTYSQCYINIKLFTLPKLGLHWK